MSNPTSTEAKRKRAHQEAGQRRKNIQSKHSTLSNTALFAGLGEPGTPAPKN